MMTDLSTCANCAHCRVYAGVSRYTAKRRIKQTWWEWISQGPKYEEFEKTTPADMRCGWNMESVDQQPVHPWHYCGRWTEGGPRDERWLKDEELEL
jgi:hypothetical protein